MRCCGEEFDHQFGEKKAKDILFFYHINIIYFYINKKIE